jgi:hypothetical protein
LHGQKVSLEQIEIKLSDSFGSQVVCTASETITAFVKTNARLDSVDISELFEKSRKVLLSTPEMPSRFLFVEKFPLSQHGKIDRKKLALLGGLPAPMPHTVDSPAQLLALLWNRFLGRRPESQEYFLSSGGDSFLAVALVNALTDSFSNVPPGLLEALLSEQFATVLQMLVREENVTEQPVRKRLKLDVENNKNQELVPVLETRLLSPGEVHTKTKKLSVSSESAAVYRCKGRQNIPRPAQVPTHQSNRFNLVWKVDFEKCIDSSPLYVSRDGEEEGVVVVGSHAGWVKCVRCSSGQEVWATRYLYDFSLVTFLV